MKPSEFLRYCARCALVDLPIKSFECVKRYKPWWEYVDLTLPTPADGPYRPGDHDRDIRILRLCLAAAIAEAEGN